jgi:hypothetical protein
MQKRYASIFIGESQRNNRNSLIEECCKNISARRPFEKEDYIDYEIDTEDELEEQVKFNQYGRKQKI